MLANAPPNDPDSPTADRPSGYDDVSPEQLRRYVRSSIIKGVLGLVGLVAGMAFVGKYFDTELVLATTWVYDHLGLAGLAAILLLTDSFITPIPPDVLLIIIAKSALADSWWIVVPGLGVLSSGAGMIGWHLSRRVGDTRLMRLMFGRFRRRHRALVARYGTVAVALGALTPIPFSVTCWAAGIFQMPFKRFAWVTLLRIPRFVGYYLLIAWSVDLL